MKWTQCPNGNVRDMSRYAPRYNTVTYIARSLLNVSPYNTMRFCSTRFIFYFDII